ncbi:NAD(P)-binding domain-containing protein, partial [Streptomyces sp. NPDC049577]|uniref:NAD(P)-binding domain-containing protein n=1 Tax=Streptomyces sp. NPDC049577 TaxID=3155153 RepID=UPI00343E0A30
MSRIPASPTVAVLGTGIMGAPMARNLARAGLPVRAWNRTGAKAEPLAGDGVAVSGTPAEAVDGVVPLGSPDKAAVHLAWAVLGGR